MTGFLVFLAAMWLCTVISKSIYASRLPIVSTESIESKYVEHVVKVDGIVVAGEKNPVTALGGLRVERLAVQVGDQVEEGMCFSPLIWRIWRLLWKKSRMPSPGFRHR